MFKTGSPERLKAKQTLLFYQNEFDFASAYSFFDSDYRNTK